MIFHSVLNLILYVFRFIGCSGEGLISPDYIQGRFTHARSL